MDGVAWLMAAVLYGAGLSLQECIRLRIMDFDFGYRQIMIRDGKGQKDGVTLLPALLKTHLQRQIEKVRIIHTQDMVAFISHTHWNVNIRMQAVNLCGSICSPPSRSQLTRAPNTNEGIMSQRIFYRGH